jgi:hypothetical protein
VTSQADNRKGLASTPSAGAGPGADWFRKLRLRALAILVGAGLTALALASFLSLPAWPIIGVAVATVAVVISQMASKLSQPLCLHCGDNLAGQRSSDHGVICPGCGTLNDRMTLEGLRAMRDSHVDEDEREA